MRGCRTNPEANVTASPLGATAGAAENGDIAFARIGRDVRSPGIVMP